MSNASDFIIENGVLIKYVGHGGDVTVPDGVFEIGSFAFSKTYTGTNGWTSVSENDTLYSVILPDSVEHIQGSAFSECTTLEKVIFSSNLRTIDSFAFHRCISLEELTLPSTLESIGKSAFFGYMTTQVLEIYSDKLTLPEDKLSILHNAPAPTVDLVIFAPRLALDVLKKHGLGMQAAKTFIKRYSEYESDIFSEYIAYISSQKKKLLPFVLDCDEVSILQALYDAKKITKKNYEADYLLPAKQRGARKCEELLLSLFEKEADPIATANPLWDGTYFSFDGKKLLKYKDESGNPIYHVPDGTTEINKNAFFMAPLDAVILPESVTTIRNGAFIAKGGRPLFIKLPDSLEKLPAEVFLGGFWPQDDDTADSSFQKTYYVSTSSAKFAEQTSCSSYSKGDQCPVYTGGPLDNLLPRAKPYAVKGFLYAAEHNLEDLTKWKGSYLKYIKDNEKKYLALAENDDFLLHLMIQESLLSENGVKILLESEAFQGNVSAKVAVLDYHNRMFPPNNQL